MSIPQRKIGTDAVPEIGYGCMGLAMAYSTHQTQEQCDKIFNHLLSIGVTHWDTSNIYSSTGELGEGEEQIGNFFSKNSSARSKVFLATKHNNHISKGVRSLKGGADYAIESLEASLKRLNTDHVDLFYSHRPVEPVEETLKGMKVLQDQGKIRYIGVSEYNLDQLERANKIAHIDALQIELSAWTPDVLNNGILEWCKKNGTALIAYSPLGRGFLSGDIKSPEDLGPDDNRRNMQRFQGENFEKNLKLVADFKEIAEKKKASASQVALSWLLALDPIIHVIPGSTKLPNIDSNVDAVKIKLDSDEMKEINDIVSSFKTSGLRYAPAAMKGVAF